MSIYFFFFFAIFQYENKKKIEKQNKKENFVGHERHIATNKKQDFICNMQSHFLIWDSFFFVLNL
jgi:hypothetical protein